MQLKQINVTVPFEKELPEIITSFSPEENYLMLKIGCECLREGRNVVIGLTQKEIYQKIKQESKEEIEKIEMELLVEREMSKKMEEKISKMYLNQIEQMKGQIELLNKELMNYENENGGKIQEEINKAREKFEISLQDKEKQITNMTEAYHKLLTQNNKSMSHKGTEGEKQFKDYAETFMDFKGFELMDKHTKGGEGDFHMRFEEFDVLVDAKNYKTCVPSREREKIKSDLMKNTHIHFAWLVSLESGIDKYDKSPIMYEWINTRQCIVYINKLTSFKEPTKILRIVWFTCKELYKFVEDVNEDNEELIKLREKQYVFMDKIKNLRKNIREINTMLNGLKNSTMLMDSELKEILESETNQMIESNFSLFDDWWNQNIDATNEEEIVLSTDLWLRFKQDNKDVINEFEITTEKFKQFIKSKVSLSNITIRSKSSNGAFDIKGIKWRVREKEKEKEPENPKMELELKENKKVKKLKKEDYYFDENKDTQIIKEYENTENDIMEMSKTNNIRPWEIVSVLMKHKIIKKRADARGYDKYKETDEYKSKIK